MLQLHSLILPRVGSKLVSMYGASSSIDRRVLLDVSKRYRELVKNAKKAIRMKRFRKHKIGVRSPWHLFGFDWNNMSCYNKLSNNVLQY
jgi:hypothetical protein